MRKGFVDFLVLLFIIFVLPIWLLVAHLESRVESNINTLKNGGSLICELDNNTTLYIEDTTGWRFSDKVGYHKEEGLKIALVDCRPEEDI